MEEPAKANPFLECSCCGKSTFKDLLDEEMVCEYCKEIQRTRSHSARGRRSSRKKQQASRNSQGVVAAVDENKSPSSDNIPKA